MRTLICIATCAVARVAAADGAYTVRVDPPAATAATGERGAFSLTIAPAAGYEIDADAPLRVRLSARPPGGLDLPRPRLTRADAADPRAAAPRFDLPFVAREAGDYAVDIDVRFWLCRRYTCRAVHARRRARVHTPASPARDAGGPDAPPPGASAHSVRSSDGPSHP
ncbi:MAG: hypothetical protein D6689_20150 [Deltaproteobacteria bacterium]|nr:MAG: hypothetical protein D6689_20150 [Deltaproteobacteria bacterium]